MKKMMHMIFSFSLSFLIFASNICLAARPICLADEPRPMTEQERDQFTSDIEKYFLTGFFEKLNKSQFINDNINSIVFSKDLKKNCYSKQCIAKFIISFETNNDTFDEANELDADETTDPEKQNDKLMFFGNDKDFINDITITEGIFIKLNETGCFSLISKGKKTFLDAITLYHNHISNIEEFLKQPLCCRALSAYILHKLIKMGIECKYVKFTIPNKDQNSGPKDHDVVAYKVDDKWYVCDLMFALVSEMLLNHCNKKDKFAEKQLGPDIFKKKLKFVNWLKMPIYEYKGYMKPVDNTWDEIEITSDILKLDYSIVLDHRNKFPKLRKIIDFLSNGGNPKPIKNFINTVK